MPFTNVTKKRADDGSLYHCPCCGFRTLAERAGYEICPVCFWEDDGQDDHDADEVRGGPNSDLSLTRARQNYREFAACDRRSIEHVRKPTLEEM
jgi:hypothetical protein